jgi:iron complex outermembrane receptor protein
MLGSSMFENSLDNPLISYDCAGYFGSQCGFPSARWRHRVRASWKTTIKATLSLGWRYIHGTRNDDASENPDLGNPGRIELLKLNGSYEIPAYSWFDLAAAYQFRQNLRMTVDCNNIFDREPPVVPGVTGGLGFVGLYDYLGRTVYANLQFDF